MAEGKENCIVIEKVANAATHVLVRRELYGVALSNGTLTGRLKHYHSLVTSHAYFGLIPSSPFLPFNKNIDEIVFCHASF